MKKILILTTALLLGFTFCSFAQEYDLNQYKYRFQKYQFAEGNFNLGGSGFLNKADNVYLQGSREINDENRDVFGSGVLSYGKLINKNNLQLERTFNGTSNFGSQQSNNLFTEVGRYKEIYTSQERSFLIGFNANQTTRFYKENNNFNLLIVGFDGNYSNSIEKSNTAIFSERENKTYRIGNRIGLGKGIGRLEYVTDAVTAQFILLDIKRKAGDDSELTNLQIETLAKGITTSRNTRFLDQRFRLIDQIEMLDSFVKNAGVETTNNLRYFTSLYDNWLYATKLNRTSGKRLSIYGLTETYIEQNNRFQLDSNSDHFDSKDRYTSNRSSLNIDYINSKQLNFKNQRSFNASAFISLGHNTDFDRTKRASSSFPNYHSERKSKFDNIYYKFNIGFEHLYQPNSRTFLIFSLSEELGQNRSLYGLRQNNDRNEVRSSSFLNTNASFSFFRFLSPHLSFNINAIASYSNYTNKFKEEGLFPRDQTIKRNYITGNVNIAFAYAIF